ncbi:hypothetical protein [Lentzea sp. NPDC059081]|uniref:hypothetical protein n=1 Tax=Lentzea sp. NPDC059081 TaxID=3346719 RepID=UPI003680FAE5
MWGKRLAALCFSVLLTGFGVSVAHAGTGVVPASTSWTSADRGWVLGLDTLCQIATCPQLVRTVDGGTTWARVRTPALTVPETDRLRVVFASDAAGMVTDGGQLFVTSDGGTRWEPSGLKGTVGALGFDDAGFLAVIYDGTSGPRRSRSAGLRSRTRPSPTHATRRWCAAGPARSSPRSTARPTPV